VFLQYVRQKQVSHLNAFFQIFVAVNGRDAPFGRPVFGILQPPFLQGVLFLVKRKNNNCPVADSEILGRDRDPLGPERLHFLAQMLKVDNGAVSKDIDDTLVKDAGRNQVEREFPEFIDNCVAGVAAVPDTL
jgi:hypothetical protein